MSSRKRILLNTATIRDVNSTAIDFFSLKLAGERTTGLRAITTPTTISQFQNTQLNLLIVTLNRDKLALFNRRWKSRKGQRLTITGSLLTKIDQHDNFTRAFSRRYRDRGQRKENPDRAQNQSDCRICYRTLLGKNK